MSDLPIEGSLAHPVRLDPFQRIVGVQWASGGWIEITYPDDFQFHFSPSETVTTAEYNIGDVIDKQGADPELPIIRVRFRADNNNPVSDQVEFVKFVFQELFGERALIVQPHITVPFDFQFTQEDQARMDALVADFNNQRQLEFTGDPGAEQRAIDAFAAVHPEATIFRHIVDLRGFVAEPQGGWRTLTYQYLPDSEWANYPHMTRQTITFPEYILIGAKQVFTGNLLNVPRLLPAPPGVAFGKYASYAHEHRDRDSYILNTAKLPAGGKLDIVIDTPTRQTNAEVQIDLFKGGGTFTAGDKRTILSDSPNVTSTTRRVSGAGASGSIIASIDRGGFVA